MKVDIVFVLTCFAILKVCAGRVFDEKDAAKKEIETKFKEVITQADKTLKFVEDEKKLVNKSLGEEELKKYLVYKRNASKIQFESDAHAVIRTAIVQAKPVAVIYCIRNIIYIGYDTINNVFSKSLKEVYEVKIKKLDKIDFDIFAIKTILSGLKELMEQAKKKIDEEPHLIQNIKKEALKRCESATLIFGEIEVCIHEPVLSREYIKLRHKIDRSFKDTESNLNLKLEECLKIKML